MNECVLLLIVSRELEDALIDWLLDYHAELIFTSQAVSCHGLSHTQLDTAEQVTGKQQRLSVQIQLSVDEAREVCARLHQAFPRAQIRYWITPVLESGQLG